MRYRKQAGKSDAILYYISTSYAYEIYKKTIPEDYPEFHPGKPENTYVQTKAEAKLFILYKIKTLNDKIVVFEPTIIGGSAKTGMTRAYNMHYIVIMLGYLGKLSLLTSPKNKLDIVPVDWVSDIISDIMVKNEFHQGVMRLASGKNAVRIKHMNNVAYYYYVKNNPVPGRVVPRVYFAPKLVDIRLDKISQRLFNSARLTIGQI